MGTDNLKAWLGVDLGTQGVRATIVYQDGTVIGSGEAQLESRRSSGRHEQDPERWWMATNEATQRACSGLEPGRLGGMATCSTSGTIALLRPGGSATTGLMYDDGRATVETATVNDVGADVWQRQGYRMQPSWALPKLVWLLRHSGPRQPGERVVHQADYVNERLVGHAVATDESHALKTGYDLRRREWPATTMERLGVAADLLPRVVPAGTRLGEISQDASLLTGIPATTPVFAGMTDGCAAQLASGAISPGDASSVLGTTLVVKGVSTDPVCDPNGILYAHRSPFGGWMPGGASNCGAGALLRAFRVTDYDRLTDAAKAYEPARSIVYPLTSRGERFPFLAADAEPFETGRVVDDAERFAGVLQGVAYAERLCFDYMDLLGVPCDGELRVTGGATQNRYWSQLRADVLGREVAVPQHPDPGVGMALLAAASQRDLVSLSGEMIRVSERFEPRSTADRFAEPYSRYLFELERRGWLPSALATHARNRLTR